MTFIEMAPPALAGILLQEVLHWYKLRGLLGQPETKAILINPAYWGLFVLVCILGTIFIYFFVETGNYRDRDVALMGAALPSMFRELASGSKAGLQQEVKLGGKGKWANTFQSLSPYFT